MTKQEALKALEEGKTLTHHNFDAHEWVKKEGNNYLFEDGVRLTPEEFWMYRTVPSWKNDWQLVEPENQGQILRNTHEHTQPEQKPFTPTHEVIKGWYQNVKVEIEENDRDSKYLAVVDEEGTRFDIHRDDVVPINCKTHLSESQHQSLVSMIFDKLREFEEIGMGEVGECKDEAHRIVREWAEQNEINLP